eukprot:scaffold279393_cov35-Tisochrysis_lutea.AAC.3
MKCAGSCDGRGGCGARTFDGMSPSVSQLKPCAPPCAQVGAGRLVREFRGRNKRGGPSCGAACQPSPHTSR